MGARPFTREGQTMALTEAGRLLLEHADLVFGTLTRAREALDGLKGLEHSHLRVGAASTIGTHLLLPLLGRFKTFTFPVNQQTK